jgi:chromosomal replication initiation ATPase DnaA
MTKTAKSVWKECLINFKANTEPQAFKTWFKTIKPISLINDTLTIEVPSKFFYEWLEEHYIALISFALTKSIGENAKLIYNIRMESYSSPEKNEFEKLINKNDIKNIYSHPELKEGSVEVSVESPKEYDVFISHSSEDKEGFVRPLVDELKKLNIKVWYDEFELKIGDSLRESLDKGLKNSKYGIVVLSTSFFNRNWTKYELNSFVSREMNGKKVILPIWHKVTKDEVQNFSLSLADKVALNSSTSSKKQMAEQISKII